MNNRADLPVSMDMVVGQHCYGAHRIIAERFGLDETFVSSTVTDPGMPLVSACLRPVLAFVRKLTRSPDAPVNLESYRDYGREPGLIDAAEVTDGRAPC